MGRRAVSVVAAVMLAGMLAGPAQAQVLYGITRNDQLITIDTVTGAGTLVGPLSTSMNAPGIAFRIAVVVRGIGGNPVRLGATPFECCPHLRPAVNKPRKVVPAAFGRRRSGFLRGKLGEIDLRRDLLGRYRTLLNWGQLAERAGFEPVASLGWTRVSKFS